MAISTSLKELTVLLVEPSTMQAHVVQRMLANLNTGPVQVVESGKMALEAMHGEPPGVVISAMYLPDMAGTELVTAMRADSYLEPLPFILISSEARPQVLDPIRQSGACSIVPKPFTEAQLAQALYAAADYLNPPADIDTAELEGLRVLIVDDSGASRRHLRRLLEELGIQRITEAADGTEAVKILGEMTFDLVITDYNMPEMDGHQLTEYIRTQSWQASVPILMVTSEQNAGRLAAVQKAGVSAICDKPFEATGIRQVIAQAVLQ